MSGSEDGETLLKKYSWEEIKSHQSPESLWVVVHDKVYDVTKFMDEHPGGEEVLMEQAGRNATEAFEDVGHSPDARDMQKQYLIGVVAAPSRERVEKRTRPDNPSSSTASSSWSTTGLIVLFLVLLAAYVYRNYAHLFETEQKGQ